jgi:hypothetical protein
MDYKKYLLTLLAQHFLLLTFQLCVSWSVVSDTQRRYPGPTRGAGQWSQEPGAPGGPENFVYKKNWLELWCGKRVYMLQTYPLVQGIQALQVIRRFLKFENKLNVAGSYQKFLNRAFYSRRI